MQYSGNQDDKMRRADEIYTYKRQIENLLERIRQDPHNSKNLQRYYNARVADGISNARIHKCLCTLRLISETLAKPFEEATKEDLVKLIAHFETKPLAPWTKRDYRVIIKHFYKWLRNWEDGMPPEVRWIKKTTNAENKRPILPKDLLTQEEKTGLVRAARNPRDSALLEVLLESGRRLGEILTLHIRDVEFDEVGAKLSIHGKVGDDFARIISSAPALRNWFENHPMKDDPESPLWIGVIGGKNRQIVYDTARSILLHIAKRAGIKKRIHFYLFRHTRVDETQGILTEAQQCMMFGWKFGSRMPATYMKRYGKHIDNAQAIMNGVTLPQVKTVVTKPKECIRCRTENSPLSKFCYKCGESLEIKFGVEVEDRKKKIERLLDGLLKDPQELENLRNYLAERHNGKA